MAILQFLRFLKPKYLIGAVIIGAAFWFIHAAIDRAILEQQLKNFKATEAQNHERKETNETIRNADERRKCELLGGVFADGECG